MNNINNQRSLFNHSIMSLEKLVENTNEIKVLHSVAAELKHRSTQRSQNLMDHVKNLIQEQALNQSSISHKSNEKLQEPMLDNTPSKNSKPSFQYPNNFLKDSFEDLRKKLLDTSGFRSRLLNLDLSRKDFVRIVDEVPNSIKDKLLSELGLKMDSVPEPAVDELLEFEYLSRDEETHQLIKLKPDPTAKEWAAIKGINNEYELPSLTEEKHTDNNLQALLFEPHLNNALSKLDRESKTAIEETGNNILFLTLGFLEYTDQSEREGTAKKRLAPLFLIPVLIEKGVSKGITHFYLKYTGEDILDNLTLKEKLEQEHELYLPSVYDEQEELRSPENYFEEVKALLARKSNDPNISQWKVHRFGAIATLSLGKLLMYKDLDPSIWPNNGASLLEHKIISSFFSADSGSNEAGLVSEDYEIDTIPSIHQNFPLIENADSSQISALIDALNGKNLVIEGPPGTGKSQTITNLIAAALSQKKTVLFISEKQAALEVVMRRLKNAGFEDFCLNLHSDNVQKKKVLDSFEQRITNQSRYVFSENDYQIHTNRYEGAKTQLQNYVQIINSKWKNTGLTVHEILTGATRYAKEVEPLNYESVRPSSLTSDQFSRVYLDDQLHQLELFYDYFKSVSLQLTDIDNWASHPWYGVNNKTLSSQAIEPVIIGWNQSLRNLYSAFEDSIRTIGEQVEPTMDNILLFRTWLKEWKELPILQGKEIFTSFKHIKAEDIPPLVETCKKIEKSASLYQKLANVFTQDFLSDLDEKVTISEAIAKLQDLGVSKNLTLEELGKNLQLIKEAISLLNKFGETQNLVCQSLAVDLKKLLVPSQAGLKELVQLSSFAEKLSPELIRLRSNEFDDSQIDAVIEKFKDELTNIADMQSLVEHHLNLEEIPSVEVLQRYSELAESTGLFSFLNKEWRAAKNHYLKLNRKPNITFKEASSSFKKAKRWLSAVSQLNNNNLFKDVFKTEFKGVETNIEQIALIRAWYKEVRNEYGAGFSERSKLAKALFECPSRIFQDLQNLSKDKIGAEYQNLKSSLDTLSQIFTKKSFLKDQHFNLLGSDFPLILLNNETEESLRGIQRFLLDPNLSQEVLVKALGIVDVLFSNLREINGVNASERFFAGTFNFEVPKNGSLPDDYDALLHSVSLLQHVYGNVTVAPLRAKVISCNSSLEYEELKKVRAKLNELEESEQRRSDDFLMAINNGLDSWMAGQDYTVSALVNKNIRAIENSAWLDGWIKYLYALERLEKNGFVKLKDYLTSKDNSIEHVKNIMSFACYWTIANEVYAAIPILSEKSGHEQTAIQKKFIQFDEDLKEVQRKRIAAVAASFKAPMGEKGAKVSSYTEASLLQHEISKKTRHIAVRRLVERAGKAMQAYKPCFMMSPMAVAKYIPPGALEFDLVVMDEASQVKQEYALSCFARGKTAVVVGDPKQLPPTSFFEKSTSNLDDNDDEMSVIQDSESILEAIAGFVPKRMLQWHYRSRHQSLIDFSNYHFYDSRLVVFPSPWDQSDEFGIKRHFVSDGRFLAGENRAEARAVAEAIKHHIMTHGDESLGVVAMNSKQRDLIELELELLASNDHRLLTALARNETAVEPLFIKNLENVQGDERDVIFISFTYGPSERGLSSIPQRFGPINSINGWRRLNVLFTRAKKRKHIFTSMLSGQILVSETSSRGVQALKDYLTYVETGQLSGVVRSTGKEPDSDFEVAVIKALEKHGFQCEAQLGVEGYFIDIAVRDPGMPGRFLMGIECDGATYHQAKSTRDRDKVRQSVLEGLGWNIKRIWSTDWFKNADAELKPIIDELVRIATPIQQSLMAGKEVSEDETIESKPIGLTENKLETLEERLLRYQKEVIHKELPDTAEDKRLLRPEILQRLVEFAPRDRNEFAELIPNYLRTATDTNEASLFLEHVLEIIAEYEERPRQL